LINKYEHTANNCSLFLAKVSEISKEICLLFWTLSEKVTSFFYSSKKAKRKIGLNNLSSEKNLIFINFDHIHSFQKRKAGFFISEII